MVLPCHPRTEKARGLQVSAQLCHSEGWSLGHITSLSLHTSPVGGALENQYPGGYYKDQMRSCKLRSAIQMV